MNREELVCVWFNYEGYGFLKLEKILKNFNKIDGVFDKNLLKNALFDSDTIQIKEKLLKLDVEKFERKVEDDLYKNDLVVVTYVSKEYPEKLKYIDDPPLVLYAKGDVSLLSKKSISIVGTRSPSDYGKLVCERFTKELSSSGLVTISGLAYGIDAIVARTTLDVGGKTIAVLAGGLDSIYPSSHTNLAKEVAGHGLLLSEARVGLKPANYSFINRNRIVSALGLGTLIIEAGKQSGTMATAKFAIDQGRELFIVPGNIYSKMSEGTNNLIDEMPDTFTISPDRILSRLKIKKKESKVVQLNLTDENIVLDALAGGEKTFDELFDIAKLSAADLSTELVRLEMMGLIKKGAGDVYFKI